MVGGMRSRTSSNAGVSAYHDFPKSPCAARDAKVPYCTQMGRSTPSSLRWRPNSPLPAFWGSRRTTGSPSTCRIAKARIEMPTMTTTSWTSCCAMWRFIEASRSVAEVAPRRPPRPGDPSLLGARLRHEHPIDLVPRRFVVDAVRDAPHAAEAPFEEVRRVVEHQLLRLRVGLRPLLAVERRPARIRERVELLVAVVAVRLATVDDVEE